MRKIKTAQDAERIQRRNSMIMGITMIGLLIFASLGYSLMSANRDDSSTVSELGFDFVRDGGLWKVKISGEVFGFQYLPSEVEDIEVNLTKELGEYSGKPLYFVNPNEGASEVLNNVGRYILRYQEACVEPSTDDLRLGLGNESTCKKDLPTKDCNSNLIIFENGNETKVYGDENCVYVVGDDVRVADAFLYEVLNVR